MATRNPGGARGRRKQAKPQRKVELDGLNNETSAQTGDQMSPDTNHNEISHSKEAHKRFIEAHVLEELEVAPNGLSMRSKRVKTGGSAEDAAPSDLISAKAAVGEPLEDEELKEYLQRSDTAVIYPEPVGQPLNVSSPMTNGIKEEGGGELADYYIKCRQCQKGCAGFQALKEHMEAAHGAELAVKLENGGSPAPGPFGCAQCAASFAAKDQLEKHELLHSPNAQVSCKICNKTFANVYRLQRHMISHDESAVLRKFKCTECDKAFKFKHHLKEHIRIHSGEKPFECQNCGKRFSHSGSYSSHMTSKKCLVMNLKLGRANGRPPTTTSPEKNPTLRANLKSPINNNLATSPNHNAYLPIMPKYSDAAAAFLQSSLATNAASMSPFYLAPPTLHPGISPYSMPNLGHIFEQLQQHAQQQNNAPTSSSSSPLRTTIEHQETTQQHEPIKSNSSECDLVMDEEDAIDDKDKHPPEGDLEAVKRILETVNATVTKQLLQANMQKFSSESSSDCPSISSVHSSRPEVCQSCKKCFESVQQLEEHECEQSEGLAAKLEDIATVKTEDYGSVSGGEEHERCYDDCESVTTTEDGRKVRVRSLISDEQLKVLKDNYKLNPRPKREDLEKIAESIGFPVRVVQVWFQNTRARDRREGRLIQVPYSPASMVRYPALMPHKMISSLSVQSPASGQYGCEQPLDLSTKKCAHEEASSPEASPRRESDEAVNLSAKSPAMYHLYQSSNSSEPRQSPSPIDFNSTSRLAQILAQPKLGLPHGMSMVPMEQLMQLGATDLPSLSQLISNRLNSLSPNSKKFDMVVPDGGVFDEEMAMSGGGVHKRSKVSQFVLKSLGSPVLGQEQEVEGQFSCDQCDKAFSKQSSLARHKYEHSGQRPHKCDECPKAFKHKHHLTEHKRLHSGEKPFQCIKCLKRFSHSGSYSQHMNHRYSYCKPYRE